jgi:hypothetical protein
MDTRRERVISAATACRATCSTSGITRFRKSFVGLSDAIRSSMEDQFLKSVLF